MNVAIGYWLSWITRLWGIYSANVILSALLIPVLIYFIVRYIEIIKRLFK